MDTPALDAVRRMKDGNPAAWADFSLYLAVMLEWDCEGDPTKCSERLTRILNSSHRRGHAPRNFDINWGYWMLDFFPEDELTPLFVRRASIAAAKREIEADAEQPKMRKVESRRRDERRSA